MKYTKGLTTVELLVALFVASIFLLSGYQLYTYVFRNGTQTTRAAELSNAVYAEMRTKAAAIPASTACPALPTTSTKEYTSAAIPAPGATITVVVSCINSPTPASPLDKINKITSSAEYKGETITHAIYK